MRRLIGICIWVLFFFWALLPLLHTVMAMCAQGLKVVPVPEQRRIAFVGLDVVHMLGAVATHRTEGV